MKQLSLPSNKINKDSLSVVSLFAGCGGMDLGFVNSGYNIIWSNDYNEWACKTYKRNFKHNINCGDIANVNIRKIPKSDIVLGGFPCQDFSMIWKRGGINTERGNLYQYLVQTVENCEPKVFIAENVRGILSANNYQAVEKIQDDFSRCGYNVEPYLVNFADYGVPQMRYRVLIIGTHVDLNKRFELPGTTHNKSNYVPSKHALKDVEKSIHNNEHQNIRDRTVEILKRIKPGGNFSDIPKGSKYYVKGMISHVYRRLDPNKPSNTIIAGGGGGTWGYHYKEPRPLTNRERARLFGFPDEFVFEGSITEVRRQIGNAVPPTGIIPFAKKIKEIIQDQ